MTYSYEKYRLFFDLRHLFMRKNITWWFIGSCVIIYIFITIISFAFLKIQKSTHVQNKIITKSVQFKRLDNIDNGSLRIELNALQPDYGKTLDHADLKIWDDYDLIFIVSSSKKLGKRYADYTIADPQKKFGSYEQFTETLISLKKFMKNEPDINSVIYFSPSISGANHQIKKVIILPYDASSDRIIKNMLSDKKMSFDRAKVQH